MSCYLKKQGEGGYKVSLEELAKGGAAVFLAYVKTVRDLKRKYKVPDSVVDELLAENTKLWRKLIET